MIILEGETWKLKELLKMKIERWYVLRSLFQTGGEQVDITKNIIQVCK
jgi:hypothetical protein